MVLVDTAGRLQNKAGLMDELGKVKRVVEKQAPVTEVLLVLDATTGQNGLLQARVFREVVDVTGIVLTKLDGSAKGGIVVAVQRELGVPVKLVGIGEGADDLAPFDPRGVRRRAAGRAPTPTRPVRRPSRRRGERRQDATPRSVNATSWSSSSTRRHRPVLMARIASRPPSHCTARRRRCRGAPRRARWRARSRRGSSVSPPLGRGAVERRDAVVAHRLRDGRAQERLALGGVHEGEHARGSSRRRSLSIEPVSGSGISARVQRLHRGDREVLLARASGGRRWPCRRRRCSATSSTVVRSKPRSSISSAAAAVIRSSVAGSRGRPRPRRTGCLVACAEAWPRGHPRP